MKEHKKVEEQNRKIQDQEATITELRKGMETVVAQLKEQGAQIQRVSAQLEVQKPAAKSGVPARRSFTRRREQTVTFEDRGALRVKHRRKLEGIRSRRMPLQLCQRRLPETPLQLCSRDSIDLVTVQQVVEASGEICVEWIRPVGFCGAVAPMLVHPEPGRWILSHVSFE